MSPEDTSIVSLNLCHCLVKRNRFECAAIYYWWLKLFTELSTIISLTVDGAIDCGLNARGAEKVVWGYFNDGKRNAHCYNIPMTYDS